MVIDEQPELVETPKKGKKRKLKEGGEKSEKKKEKKKKKKKSRSELLDEQIAAEEAERERVDI